MRFLTRGGEIRILFSLRGEEVVGMIEDAWCVTGIVVPLPTRIGDELKTGWEEENLPELEARWEEAPVSMYHSAV